MFPFNDKPPATTKAPVLAALDSVEFVIVTLPTNVPFPATLTEDAIEVAPPTVKVPPKLVLNPTAKPPDKIKAPDVTEDESSKLVSVTPLLKTVELLKVDVPLNVAPAATVKVELKNAFPVVVRMPEIEVVDPASKDVPATTSEPLPAVVTSIPGSSVNDP